MVELRLPALAARVAAWHNRNPLARRVTPGQIKSIGYVALAAGDDDAAAWESAQSAPAAAPAPAPAQHHSATGAAARTPAAPAAVEDDFTAAFAAMAAQAAADGHDPDRPPADADAGPDPAPTPVLSEPTPGAGDDAVFEVDLEMSTGAAGEAGGERALDGAAAGESASQRVAEAPVVPAAPVDVIEAALAAMAQAPPPADDIPVLHDELPMRPEPAPHPGSAAAVYGGEDDSDTLLAAHGGPRGAAAPGGTLRDRLLQRPAGGTPVADAPVQGALLADHPAGAKAASQALAAAASAAAFQQRQGDLFMAPLSPRTVARWVARHGLALAEPPQDGPVRRVRTARVKGGPSGGASYVMTAAIDVGGLRSRVLVGAGEPGVVMGARLLSGPRVAIAATLAMAVLSASAWGLARRLPAGSPLAYPAATAAASAAASAASSASAPAAAPSASAASAAAADVESPASAAAGAPGDTLAAPAGSPDQADRPAAPHPAPATPTAAQPGHPGFAPTPKQTAAAEPAEPADPADPTHAAGQAPSPAAPVGTGLVVTTVRPLPAYAQKGRIALPARGSAMSDDDKAAAREAVRAARAEAGRRPAEPALPTAPAAPAAPAARVAAPSPVPAVAIPARPATQGPVFAVTTRSLRTRAEAEQVQAAMAALLQAAGLTGAGVELLPEGADWRVIAWPLRDAATADRARALLAARGMKVDVVGL